MRPSTVGVDTDEGAGPLDAAEARDRDVVGILCLEAARRAVAVWRELGEEAELRAEALEQRGVRLGVGQLMGVRHHVGHAVLRQVGLAEAERGLADGGRQVGVRDAENAASELSNDRSGRKVLGHPARREHARVGPGGDAIVGDALRERLAGERDGETRRDERPLSGGALRDGEHEPGNEQREEPMAR